MDVFSDRPFGGNQLAVFPDAGGIAGQIMQRLARELNFSETTFVLPPADPSCTCRVRIFTPRQELPFAGHPTLGTAAVLARRNGGQAAPQFVFEEGTGPVVLLLRRDCAPLLCRHSITMRESAGRSLAVHRRPQSAGHALARGRGCGWPGTEGLPGGAAGLKRR